MQANENDRFVSAKLDVLLFPTSLQIPAGANCRNCESPLTLIQPDMDMPERLIGACEECKHWYLIDMIPGKGEGIFSKLPDCHVIRGLSQQNEGDGISVQECDPEETLVQPEGLNEGAGAEA